MRHISLFLVALVLITSPFLSIRLVSQESRFDSTASWAAEADADFVPGEILVRWRDGAVPGVLPEGVLGLLDISPATRIARLGVTRGEELSRVRQLAADPSVAWAQPDYFRYFARTVNDPRFEEQWSLPRIHVPEAWDLTVGVPFVIVAVIDSGVDLAHPDLKDRLVDGYNFLDPGSPPQDDSGHGTHAAGIIAATADNGMGIAGVAPSVTIMPLKVLESNGVGRDSVVAEAISYAVDNGAWVINMSFNGRDPSPALDEAVAYATERGVVLVVAAGNENRMEPSYPGAIKPAIAVAALTTADTVAFYTNLGPWVDLAAPGQSILSTYWDPTGESIYRVETGTSVAAPLVAGVVALMFSVQPMLTVDEIVAALRSSADPLPASGIGAGRVNAARAVFAVAPPELLTPSPTPTPEPTLVATNTPTSTATATPTRTTPLVLPFASPTPAPASGSPLPSATPSTTPILRAAPTAGVVRLTPGR